jgi:hypothetical protein
VRSPVARRTCSVASLVTLGVLLAVCGCSSKPEERRRSQQSDVDALRSLPYAGSYAGGQDEATGVVLDDAQRSCPGYNLYAIQTLSMAELIDERGRVVHSWQYEPSQLWEHCELLPNGDLLVIGAEPYVDAHGRPQQGIGDETRYLVRLDWNSHVLWKRMLHAHHDVELMPDGKLLLLTFRRRQLPEFDPTVPVRDDELTMSDPTGKVIESHSILAAVRKNPAAFPLQPVKPSTLGGPPWLDMFHSNSVEWIRPPELAGADAEPVSGRAIDEPGNVLVCFRHQNCIAVFNWARGQVVWSWGQNELAGPHDAQMLGNGHILLFDNGLGRGYSRAVEMDPASGKIVWQYKADPPESFYTASKGSAQRLPNGNTLLAESDKGDAFEVTQQGEVVWRFVCPHKVAKGERAAIVRMVRFPKELIDGLMATKGR